jgi:hypothetical protein
MKRLLHQMIRVVTPGDTPFPGKFPSLFSVLLILLLIVRTQPQPFYHPSSNGFPL